MTLPLGKHSGRHAFALACDELGYALEGEELNDAFARFKRLADTQQARIRRRRLRDEGGGPMT